jgi:hypothetical protein
MIIVYVFIFYPKYLHQILKYSIWFYIVTNVMKGPGGTSNNSLKLAAKTVGLLLKKWQIRRRVIHVHMFHPFNKWWWIAQYRYPYDLKITNVIVPLFKNANPHDVKNYRPISLICITDKVIERCVYKHVHDYLIDNRITMTLFKRSLIYYYLLTINWVSEWFNLMPNEQFFSYIIEKTSYIRWDENNICFVLHVASPTCLVWIFRLKQHFARDVGKGIITWWYTPVISFSVVILI